MKDFFNNVYKVLIERRTDFAGRSSRKEYWYSWAFIQLTSIFLLVFAFRARPLLLIYVVYVIAIIIPSLAVTVRRLHDINKSGRWLIGFLPFVFMAYISIRSWKPIGGIKFHANNIYYYLYNWSFYCFIMVLFSNIYVSNSKRWWIW